MNRDGLAGLVKSSAIYGVSLGLSRLMSLLMLPVFAAYLSPAEFGVSGFLNSLAAILVPVLSFGITGSLSVCFYNACSSESKETVFVSSAFLLTLAGVILFAFAYFFDDSISYALFGTYDYHAEVLVSFAGFSAALASQTWLLRSQLLSRALVYSVSNLVAVIVGLTSTWWFVVHLNYGALGLVSGGAITQFVLLLCLIWGNRDASILTQEAGACMIDLLKQGIPLIPGFGFLYIIQNGVRWPVQRFGSLDELGLLNLGISLGSVIGILTSAIITAWLPYAMEHRHIWSKGKHQIAGTFRLYFACGTLIVCVLTLSSGLILNLFLSSPYKASAQIIGITSYFNFLISIYSILQVPLYMSDKVKFNSIAQGVGACLTLISFVAVMFDAVFGAGLSLLLGAVFLIASQQVLIHKLASDFILPIRLLPVTRMVVVSVFVVFSPVFFWEVFPFESFLFVFLASSVLFVYCLFDSGLTRSDINYFMGFLRRVR